MISFDFDKHCTGCSACADVCPKSCITIIKGKADFWIPNVNTSTCTNCDACKRVCPVLNTKSQNNSQQKLFCSYNKNEEERKRGSSGSMMLVLAHYVLSKGGVVYGASFDENINVVHTRALSIEEVYPQCKSKYVQSDTRGVYKQVLADLKTGLYVMFVGTPCQCQALNNCVGKIDRGKLILVDFICHGVPSQDVFRKSLSKFEIDNGFKIKEITFHHKCNLGPHNFMAMVEKDGVIESIVIPSKQMPFYSAYRKYFMFRESCYECRFVGRDRVTDFTLGDFWGLQKEISDFYEKGYSMFIVNTSKGNRIFEEIEPYISAKKYSLDSPKAYNHAYTNPTKKSIIHKWFIFDYCHRSFEVVYDRFLKNEPNRPLWEKGIKLIIHKFKL